MYRGSFPPGFRSPLSRRPTVNQSSGIVALALTLTDGSHRTKTKVAAAKFLLPFRARAYKSVHNAKLRLNTYSSAGLPGLTIGRALSIYNAKLRTLAVLPGSLCTGVRTRFHYGDFG
jgi:hypothetical protein